MGKKITPYEISKIGVWIKTKSPTYLPSEYFPTVEDMKEMEVDNNKTYFTPLLLYLDSDPLKNTQFLDKKTSEDYQTAVKYARSILHDQNL